MCTDLPFLHQIIALIKICKFDNPMDVNVHSKNSRVRFDPEKSPRGPDPFWGQTYPESRSD